jgi:signal transduction histidine kinase
VLVLWIADWLIYTIPADFVAFLFLLLGWGALLYGLAYLISIRIQLGTLWTNTLVYRISRKCSGLYPRFCRSLPLMWRTVLAVILYGFVTFLMFAFCVDPWEIAPALILWFLLTALAGALLIYGSWATHTITQILRDMAGGNIHKKTDASNLFFIFRKQAESLNSLGDGLQAAVQAQMKSERLKTELITNVSHDIKTPLTSIINYSDLLLAELGHEIQPDGKAAEYAETIHRHSLRLKKLTEDLVEASKAASGAITVNFERIGLNQMLRQAVGEYEERLTAAGLTPVCRFTEEEVFISADGRLLWRVFDNLLSNIVKYSLEGTRVYITLSRNAGHAVISFKNISRDTLNVDVSELMERFVRGDASRHSEGSGLGLNIALSLCDRMNGTLTLACDGDLFRADVEFLEI